MTREVPVTQARADLAELVSRVGYSGERILLTRHGKALAARGLGPITTEILPAPPFYFAEDYHQQYLAKNPGGYCGLGGTGVSCPIGVGVTA